MNHDHHPGKHAGTHPGEHIGPPPQITPAITAQTVEQMVRGRMAEALGGRRGIAEAAVPTILFTALYLTTREVKLAVVVAVAASVALLVIRLVQRSSVQFVVNSMVGIGIGVFFVWLSARRGGSADDQTLAYFLPGILYNGAYAIGFLLSILARWPAVGFMVGAVAGDPTQWRSDPAVVRLCSRLTWFLLIPSALRVAVQLPIYLAGRAATDAGWHIAALGFLKLAMGWPLQLLAIGGMLWLLGRNRTPVDPDSAGLVRPDLNP